ncbi:7516_t:CDS:2 [Gigaspora rosea]|nr:7516_t:CDS:2 [Gigaspora rosea]
MPISNIEENLKLARNRLVELDRKERTTEESTTEENTTKAEESSKIVIFSDVSLERYRKFRGGEELKRFNLYVRLVRGKVIAYEMPSPAHALLAARLSHLLLLWSNSHLMVYSELDIIVGDTSEFCTDIAAEPRQTPPPTPGSALQPTLIIELARTESLNSLNSLTQNSTTAMLAILYLRNNQVPNPALNGPNPLPNTPPMITLANTTPNLAIFFGTAPLNKQSIAFVNNTSISAGRLTGFLQSTDIACTAAGMPNYQITIPANLLFMPGVVPAGVPNNFTIDLWEVQQQALYRLVWIAFTQIGNFKQ